MPTTKPRIHLSIPDHIHTVLRRVARRDRVPLATATVHLLRQALELEEDLVLQKVAEARDRHHPRFVTHKKAWR